MHMFLEFNTLMKYLYAKTLVVEQMTRIINGEDLNSLRMCIVQKLIFFLDYPLLFRGYLPPHDINQSKCNIHYQH